MLGEELFFIVSRRKVRGLIPTIMIAFAPRKQPFRTMEQCPEADERRLPAGLGRNGQTASAGLYSLSNH